MPTPFQKPIFIEDIFQGLLIGTAPAFDPAIAALGLYAFGDNTQGHLAVGDLTNRSSPTQISGTWTIVHTHNQDGFSAGIKSDGTLWSWGVNTNCVGELGL